MQMHADTRDDWSFEEPTVAEAERSPSLLGCLERVLVQRYSHLRKTTRVSVERCDTSAIAAPASIVEEILSLALLDTTGMFASASPDNHLECSIAREGGVVVFELVA